MAEKLKSLTLTKSKLADIEGEHRVTFIASSPNEDRDYEKVDIKSFRLPIKGGGHIVVQDLPFEGSEDIDVPLLLDHDLYAVEKVIGSVRKAYYQNGNLVFEAGISSRPLAQEMFTLLNEGHLDNAFSIQYRDYVHDTQNNTDINGEIIEVSLVTRGSNMDASVLAVKSLKEKGETVENTETTPVVDEEVKDEVVENTTETKVEDKATETEKKTEVENTETVEEETKAEEVEGTKVEDEVKEAEPETVVENNIKEEEKENDAMENVAKTLVVEKADQKETAKITNSDYLKTKGAVVDFAKFITARKGMSADAITKAWKAELKAKNITGDAILPTQIEKVFFKGWEDNSSILSTFRLIRSRASSMNAFLSNDRANGHKKGETKVNQTVENVRRDLKQKLVYKRLPIDLQDILDDDSGELLAFRAEELSDRVLTAIAEGVVPGDGRSAGSPDLRIFDGTRGLFSMVADLNEAAQPLDTGDQFSKYAHAVATVVPADEQDQGDNLYDKIIKALKYVRDKGYGKAVVVPFGTISDLKLEKLSNGNYLFQPGTSPETAIEARVFEMDEMANCGYDVIAYAINAYGAYISDEMIRYDFDTSTNEDIMLVERAVAGSLYGNMACAGYPSAGVSA